MESLSDSFEEVVDQFHQLHDRLYTFSVPDEPVELVNVRLRAVGTVDKPPLPPADGTGKTPTSIGERLILMPDGEGAEPLPVYRRDQLAPGDVLAGPALIEEPSSTTLVLADMDVTVDPYENMIIALSLRAPRGKTP